MKLASLKEGGRDGSLIVVSRDLSRAVRVPSIAPTLQCALEDWDNTAPRLNAAFEALQGGASVIEGQAAFALETASLLVHVTTEHRLRSSAIGTRPAPAGSD